MQSQRVETPDGISWYIERFAPGSGNAAKETIVLVPSGEGDCYNLSKLASLLAAGGPYEILTFDMPAFSRTNLPPKMNPNLTLDQIVEKIVGLLDQLKIQRASFFGCSSGGLVVLTLCANYPSRAKCGIIHEIPLGAPPDALLEMRRNWLEGKMSDEDIVAHCKHVFEQVFIEQDVNDGPRKWEALGSEYHARLAKNYVTWTKLYVGSLEPPTERLASDPGYLRRRPLFWTVGGLNQGAVDGRGMWEADFVAAERAGLKVNIDRLKCLHFPAVTIPEDTALWVQECVESVKE